MIGLELEINDKKYTAALEKGVVSVIVSIKDNKSITLDFEGLDSSDENSYIFVDWLSSNLKEGDKLLVKVKEISKISKPEKYRKEKK